MSHRDRQKKKKRTRERTVKPTVKRVAAEELKAVVTRARELGLPEADCANLEAAIETLEFVVGELGTKTLTLARLRSLFGLATSEKTRTVLGDPAKPAQPQSGARPESSAMAGTPEAGSNLPAPAKKEPEAEAAPGHGRNGVEDYTGAETLEVPHGSLTSGQTCPDCQQGRVYEQKRPRVLLRVEGQAPLKATVVKLQAFRCNLCGKVHTAEPPAEVGEDKYDATAAAMIGLLKYGTGLPFNRLEWLQGNLGIPLPASTQWDVVSAAADELAPVHEELIRQAAQAEVLHNDDTSAKILSLMAENRALKASGEADAGARTGIFATGIVALLGERRVALFFTGRKHAGENVQELLEQRAAELGPPIQMCDALDRNVPAKAETLLANCIPHYPEGAVICVSSKWPA